MKFQIALLFAIFCVAYTGASNQAVLGQFPWHVYLWMTDDTQYFYCDGGLIRYNWVLTAAHCIHSSTWIYARFGGINVFEGFERYTYIEYPEFKFTYANYDISRPYINDIGLIFLYDVGADITQSPNIGLIPLPPTADLVGLQSTVSGFGSSVTDPTTVLRHITFPVMSESWCLTRHGWSDANTLCTDTLGDESPCLEDSGGPLTAVVGGTRVLIGVGSTVDETCVAGHHGVFTRVSAHLSWINDRLNNPPPPPPPTTIPPDVKIAA